MSVARIFQFAASLLVTILAAGCATGGNSSKAEIAAASAVEATAAPSVGTDTVATPTAPASNNSPLVRPGQDPAIAGKGVDIRATAPGFGPLPTGLKARVEERWKLLIAGKGDQAYDFLTAGVKSSLSRATYASDMRTRPVRWVSAEALDAKCEATSCVARVLMEIRFSMQATGSEEIQTQAGITERWIQVEGDWFHLPEQYLEGFAK